MTTKNITITVSGLAYTGKSRLSVLLNDFLQSQGFSAELELLDDAEEADRIRQHQEQVIPYLTDAVAIKVVEKNVGSIDDL